MATMRVDTDRDLSGKVAAITGAAGAIGAGVAEVFVGAGARVVLGDTRADRVAEVAAQLGDQSLAVPHECDVTDSDQIHRLLRTATDRFGRLDVLVNVAGITHVDDILTVPLESWRKVLAVNVEGPLVASQQAAEIMSAQEIDPATGRRGTILNVSSQGAEILLTSSPAYGASKVALNYVSRTLAVALAERLVSTIIVYPGMVYEGMWKDVNLARSQAGGQDFQEVMREHLSETPTGRFQDPIDLANIVLYAAHLPGMWLNGRVVWSEAHPEW
jgi:NAD(P)-dependent dehydrogenase (short-subunit alcohol dehydrogenase family)